VKPNQTFMLIGTPSGDASAIVAPTEKIKFEEDLSEAERAKLEGAIPAGLQNLGNTCYLNSTLQVLRSIPEIQETLTTYKASAGGASRSQLQNLSQYGLGGLGSSDDLTGSLRDLYKQMSETQEGFPPIMFLNAFRTAYPQFAQKARNGQGYAQQDAEEAWSQIVFQLRQNLKITNGTESEKPDEAFVDKFMAGTLISKLSPPEEAAEKEEVVESTDSFLKLDCYIEGHQTNHLRDGILAALTSTINKQSPSLERDATYTKTSKISRAPKYLTVHLNRFWWNRSAQKKAKVMRKITFPAELDVLEFCTDDLRKRLIPVRDKVREIRKDEQDVERARKRQKLAHKQEEDRKADALAVEAAPIAKLNKKKEEAETGGKKEAESHDMDAYKTDAEYEAEREASIKAAKKELYATIDETLAADEGANKSGIYELRGVITHRGASADSGHYTSFVKKAGKVVEDPKAPGGKRVEEDGKWWWFNDDKVSEVDYDRIEALAGGGESDSALILLYRAIELPTKDEIE
jgi:ubiquitin carboxyl-terminal hydrolase 14